MTPQEKARELYHKYDKALFNGTFVKKNKIKQCALLAVDEILKIGGMISDLPLTETRIMLEAYPKFWQQVKEELNKL